MRYDFLRAFLIGLGLCLSAAPGYGQTVAVEVVRTIESETLADPLSVLEVDGGFLFVSDPLAEGLFRISPDDEWLQFARYGEGPGELQIFGGLGLGRDTLFALDAGTRSLVLFTESGDYIDELRIDVASLASIYPMSFPVALIPGGGILTSPAIPTGEVSTGRLTTVPYLRLSPSGEFRDTLLTKDVTGSYVRLETPTGFKPSVRNFFEARPTVVIDRRSSYAARLEETASGLRLTWIDLSDKSEVMREWLADRTPLQREDRDFLMNRWAEANSDRLELQPARIRSLLDDAFTIPEFQPSFTDAYAGLGGFVWLRGFSTSDEVVWTRYSVDEPSPALVTLDSEDEVMDAGKDWLWVLRRDELDVPRLVKLQVGEEPGS